MEEFYPMPLFIKLSVSDVAESSKWYQDALGFRSVYDLPGKDGKLQMSHLRLNRYQDLMLVPQSPESDITGKGQGVVISLTLDSGIEELAARVKAASAEADGPAETPWNTLDLTVTDPGGFSLTFSQVVDKDRSFDDVIRSGSG